MPDDLLEWKHVNVAAPTWAIRHFGPTESLIRTGVEVDHALGMTFSFSPDTKTAKVTYLSESKLALKTVRRAWRHSGDGLSPEIRQLAPGVITVTANMQGDAALSMFLFVLLAALGHAIVV